jgi:hypothetical protein
LLFDYCDVSSAATRVQPLCCTVIEDIVTIAYGRYCRNNRTGVRVQYEQLRRLSAYDKQAVILLVKRHRKVCKCLPGFPRRDNGFALPVDNGYLS